MLVCVRECVYVKRTCGSCIALEDTFNTDLPVKRCIIIDAYSCSGAWFMCWSELLYSLGVSSICGVIYSVLERRFFNVGTKSGAF